MPQNAVIRRKRIIFFCSVILAFFTSMSKVLIPGTIFDQLQHDLEFNAEMLSMLGSWYMYSYALAQLVGGILASSIGGIRILLLGGSCFCVGALVFPMLSSPWPMLALRLLTGFGAGVVFTGQADLIMELFERRFTTVLGLTLVVGYLGPVAGQAPMVALVNAWGWRPAMMLPGIAVALLTAAMLCFVRGTMAPLSAKPAFLKPLRETMCNWNMVTLCLASSVIFGIYYALPTLIGRKCLEDIFAIPVKWSAAFITLLALIVAAMNLFAGPIAKLFGKRLTLLMPLASLVGMLGATIGWMALWHCMSWRWMGLSYLLICIPAGCFPLYCTIAKDDCLPQHTSLAVALVNCWAFVLIALTSNLGGRIMAHFESEVAIDNGRLIYPTAAYSGVFSLFIIIGSIGVLCAIILAFRHKNLMAKD